jgi:hypothetical protein
VIYSAGRSIVGCGRFLLASDLPTAPSPKKAEDFEDPLEIIPLIKHIREARKFLKTRSAILAGVPLYLCTQSDISERGFMGPWAFLGYW